MATIPYPLIWGSGDVRIRVEDKVSDVHFERKPVSGDIAHLPHDRLGRLNYSEVTIQFPMYFRDDPLTREELHNWV